ncbi:MAG TPA: cytochrome b/b6 domain-containing protein [Acidobacteriaceae bacterium]|nr:cytochrome b/b6 domain-containing protein [Acidobacteriaceae bacterium]
MSRADRSRFDPAVLCYSRDVLATSTLRKTETLRVSAVVRVTHWITVIAFLALLISGGEIVISHPRFYWGEVGNVNVKPLFTLPIPASRGSVSTGYGYVMLDQNGWSRYLHFEAAWLAVLTGLIYVIWGLGNGHFGKNLFPLPADRTWQAFQQAILRHLPWTHTKAAQAGSYNVVQRTTYLIVIFGLFPLVIWTGLAMSPAFTAAVPLAASALGGRQSARTIHFVVSNLLVVFLVVHVTMVVVSGFKSRMRAMITGRVVAAKERS